MKREAQQREGLDVRLETKGVDFGVLRFESGAFDFSGVEGIDEDLVVRPFGRKGEFSTVRAFDLEALPFHFGIQPVEVVGVDVDADGDGVVNEIGVGPVSALEVFITTLPAPIQERQRKGDSGSALFNEMGCETCHRPSLVTDGPTLILPLPGRLNRHFGQRVPRGRLGETSELGFASRAGKASRWVSIADLKRHDMGPGLGENFGSRLDRMFTTARLWGVADTAPYMHDGRALTLNAAILMHGGEAQAAADAFAAAEVEEQAALLRFLRSLRTPVRAAAEHTAGLSERKKRSSR